MSIFFDIIAILLLAATLVYAITLNRKLAALHEGRKDLQQFIESFSASLAKAEKSVKDLKAAGDGALSSVLDHYKKALALRDDLSFMLDKGGSLVDDLEEYIHQARVIKSQMSETLTPQAPSNDTAQPAKVEPELIQKLKTLR